MDVLGKRLSWGDMANPRRSGTVCEVKGSGEKFLLSKGMQRIAFEIVVVFDDLDMTTVPYDIVTGHAWRWTEETNKTESECKELIKAAKAERARQIAKQDQERKAFDEAKKAFNERLEAIKPEWAKAVIVAEVEVDDSDIMTDYFSSHTEKTVLLAWSKHEKNLFKEMRKAAEKFKDTAHLGIGKDIWTARIVFSDTVQTNQEFYYKGSASHWHSDICDRDGESFETEQEALDFVASKGAPELIDFGGTVARFEWKIEKESVEHRENYSMGKGYYLKADHKYSTGWTVKKLSFQWAMPFPADLSILENEVESVVCEIVEQ